MRTLAGNSAYLEATSAKLWAVAITHSLAYSFGVATCRFKGREASTRLVSGCDAYPHLRSFIHFVSG
jgi:hypothetical protein